MQSIVCWWFAVELLGIVGFLAGWRAFARFPDHGFAWSKPLGTLLVGGTLWLLTALGLLRNDLGGSWIAVLLVAGVAAFGAARSRAPGSLPLRADWRQAIAAGWRRRKRLVLIEEALFLVAFAVWTTVRAADPAVEHTEQPMDLMFLNAVSVSPAVPPGDPWLAGEPISYYYFGYWLLGNVGRLAGQVPEVSYNLGQATWWGFLISSTFGLGFHLTRARLGRGAGRRAIAGGALAALGVGLAGNLHLASELLREGLTRLGGGTGGGAEMWGDWWWWRASRVVADRTLAGRPIEVITEFPFFSYLLGDNHPHLLSLPFLALAAALAIAAARSSASPQARGASGSGWLAGQNRPALLLGAITVAALVPLNTWDFPAGAALLVASALQARENLTPRPFDRLLFTLRVTLALAIGTTVVTLPYLWTAQSQLQGVRPNLFFPTSPAQVGIMFGIFLPGILLALRASESPIQELFARSARLTAGLLAAALAVLGLGHLWSTQSASGRVWLAALGGAQGSPAIAVERWQVSGWSTVAVVVLLAPALAEFAGGSSRASRIAVVARREIRARASWMLLLALGLGLIVGAELVYAQDLFGTRMNTVFKFWYQAWLFLGVASAVGLASSLSPRIVDRALRGAGLALLGLGLLFPALALAAKTTRPRWSLDALAPLANRAPDLYAAALWLRRETPWDARILEAPGESYRAEDNPLSATTGRATLLGWQGHEAQWRGSAYERLTAGRREAADAIYGATDGATLAAELERWQIDYVVFGPREHEAYGTRDPGTRARLETLMVAVFDSDSVTILRRR